MSGFVAHDPTAVIGGLFMMRHPFFKSLVAVVATMLMATMLAAPAKADSGVLTDLQAPQRAWSGAPTADMQAAADKLMPVVSTRTDVFAGAAYSANYQHIDVFYDNAHQGQATQLLTASGAATGTYQLVAVQSSADDLAAAIKRIMTAAANAGIAWSSLTPNPLVDGVDVALLTQPTDARAREIHALLTPLGMARLGVLPAGQLYDGGDLYSTPGERLVNGRLWRTNCETYSAGFRCRTEIMATIVKQVNGKFIQTNDWAFNNLTYQGMTREMWGTNPLGRTGSWTASDGRQWRTECDTPVTGGNGCRSWIKASYITSSIVNGQRTYQWTNDWTLNNMVRFTKFAWPEPVGA